MDKSPSFRTKSSPSRRSATQNIQKSSFLSSSASASTVALRDTDFLDEREQLEKANFELKMKVYQLEERLKGVQEDEQRRGIQRDGAVAQIQELRLQLEEKDLEYEQRNLLLIKAKAAIEALKSELDRLRKEHEHYLDVDLKFKKLKQSHQDHKTEAKQQITKLEDDVNALRHKLTLKEQEMALQAEKAVQMDVNSSLFHDRISQLQIEKARAEDQWLHAQQQIALLEEELTQARAHVELYRIQSEEEEEGRNSLKNQMNDLINKKREAEELHRARVQEMNSQFEVKLKEIHKSHEHELERLRTHHGQLTTEIRESYQVELAKAKLGLEKNLQDAKTNENIEILRIREECHARINEKVDEIKALRMTVTAAREQIESLNREMEKLRMEVREKQMKHDQQRLDLQNKSEEIQVLQNMTSDYNDLQRKIADLQDHLRAETMEKLQHSLRIEQLNRNLEAAEQKLREHEAELHISRMEVNKLTVTTSELGNKAESMEVIARDNEKLRILHHKLQTDLLEANHKYFIREKEFESLSKSHNDITSQLAEVKDQKLRLEAQLMKVETTLAETQSNLSSEREKRSAADSLVIELRSTSTSMAQEFDATKERLSTADKELVSLKQSSNVSLDKWMQTCNGLRRVLSVFDTMTTEVLEEDEMVLQFQSADVIVSPKFPRLAKVQSRSKLFFPSSPKQPSLSFGRTKDIFSLADADQVLKEDSEDLRQDLVLLSERLDGKLQKLMRLRQHFILSAQRVAQQYEDLLKQSSEKSTLLLHRLDRVQRDLQLCQTAYEKEQQTNLAERQEMRRMREQLQSDHTSQLQRMEESHQQLLVKYEQQQKLLSQQEATVRSVTEEAHIYKQISEQQAEELKVLESAEVFVTKLSERIDALQRESLEAKREVQSKVSIMQELQRELHQVKQDKDSALEEIDQLQDQLQNQMRGLRDGEDRVLCLSQQLEIMRSAYTEANDQLSALTESLMSTTASIDAKSKSLYTRCDSIIEMLGEKNADPKRCGLELQQLLHDFDQLISRLSVLTSSMRSAVSSTVINPGMQTKTLMDRLRSRSNDVELWSASRDMSTRKPIATPKTTLAKYSHQQEYHNSAPDDTSTGNISFQSYQKDQYVSGIGLRAPSRVEESKFLDTSSANWSPSPPPQSPVPLPSSRSAVSLASALSSRLADYPRSPVQAIERQSAFGDPDSSLMSPQLSPMRSRRFKKLDQNLALLVRRMDAFGGLSRSSDNGANASKGS